MEFGWVVSMVGSVLNHILTLILFSYKWSQLDGYMSHGALVAFINRKERTKVQINRALWFLRMV